MAISPMKEATEAKAKFLPANRIAIAWQDRRISWKEVNARTDLLASGLHRLGLHKGETCAFLFYNQPEFIETNLAIQTLGGIPVPVNFRYVADELIYVLDNSEATCFLFHRNALPLVQNIQEKLRHVKTFICLSEEPLPDGILSYEALIREADGSYPKVDVALNDTAVIIYTGGTTGRPKGVMLTYQNFRSNQEAIFSFLVQLLPPVADLDRPEFCRSELERKLLTLLSHFSKPVAPVLYAKRKKPPVALMEVNSDGGIEMPPLTITLKEGKPKIFLGKPPYHDFRIELHLGEDFRKIFEMTYYAYTWKGKLAVIPEMIRLFRSGALHTEGKFSDRLRMSLSNLKKPEEK